MSNKGALCFPSYSSWSPMILTHSSWSPILLPFQFDVLYDRVIQRPVGVLIAWETANIQYAYDTLIFCGAELAHALALKMLLIAL